MIMYNLIKVLIFTYLSTNCIAISINGKVTREDKTAPIIGTSSGMLEGLRVVKSGRFMVDQYLGVPFAMPPIGPLRFQKPRELPNTAHQKRDATKFASTCIQMRHLSQVINPLLDVDDEHMTSEDCLYLNVYVPANSTSQSLPVMVWLPGEGFDFADARQYDGSYLASLGNVIVITVQYRVGVFGFLKSDAISPGNMGLWDQVEALKWIKKNVAAFGGDANKITLFGRFTGSMSISILLTSPIMRDSPDMPLPLFNRALMISGIAVGKWVFETDPKQQANNFIESVGCDGKQLSSCMRNLSAEKILEKSAFGWKPTFDHVLIEEEPLVALEKDNFATGVTEVMLGTNEVEGSLCLLTHFFTNFKLYEKILNDEMQESDLLEAVESDIKMFLGGKNVSEETNHHQTLLSSIIKSNSNVSLREKYLDFCSSLLIRSHVDKFGKLLAKRHHAKQLKSNQTVAKNFIYRFQHKPSFSIAPTFISSAAHGEDVLFAFGLANSYPLVSSDDSHITNSFINSLTNFATTGDPNGENHEFFWVTHGTTFIKLKNNSIKHEKNEINSESNQVSQVSATPVSNTTSTEILITFLATSTTVLALIATTLVCLILFLFHRQHYDKNRSILL